ncbi:GGDEF domain-containing protein [Clostridium lacusfryxellense]|uniref:GGDEF domain-containing protein n=1 Tax=Clostridium lacusfryxellense TaxID=205328 RepID=UPI001FE5469A|nr:GGDEF domain-containing protein [Clostridium lacusfryxellense]
MINDLFINTILLIAITFIGGHILKEIPKIMVSTLYGRILLGLCGGLMGILLMIYAIEVNGTTTILDLRVFAIMIVSYIGGIVPTIVSGIIIGGYRTVKYGINISSIAAIIQIILYIIFFHIVDIKIKSECKKWVTKTLISLIILIPTFYYLLRNLGNAEIICFGLSLLIIFTSIVEYLLLNYVHKSNELYRVYKKESTKDFLTGLYNTRQFDKILNLAFERVLMNKEKLSCLMIDIDHFKKVNDTYGHATGDRVLKELAYVLRKNCREFDIVGRVGGEEFCILLLDCPKEQTFEIALRINDAVEKHKYTIGQNKFINITVSIGVAMYPDETLNLHSIKETADMDLYKAKQNGRNRVYHRGICISCPL